MREVQNKWNTLKMNDDIWAKLIYFEQNRRLAKAYVSAPVLTIDGSTNGLDGFRIGLSGIGNSYRGLDSIACLRSIGQGIKLKIDSQGNILMRKIGPSSTTTTTTTTTTTFDQCSVWVKDWPAMSSLSSAHLSSSDLSSASSSGASNSSNNKQLGGENWHMRQIDETDVSYKIFDMNKFRLQLEKRKNLPSNNSLTMDWRQCVSIISFVRTRQHQEMPGNTKSPQKTILRDPCWLMLINIIAIDMLKSSIYESRLAAKPAATSTAANMNQLHSIPKPDYSSPLELNNKPSSRGSSARKTILDYEPFIEANNHKQLRASSSIASLYSSGQQQPTTSRNGQVESDRLSRLNNSRYGHRLSTGFMGPSNGMGAFNSRPYSSSTQHLGYSNDYGNNNVIYTTFTGKYTNNNQSSNRPTTNNKSSYLADYSSTSDYNSTSKSSSNYGTKNKPDSNQKADSPSNYYFNQLYPLEDQTNTKLPFVRPYNLGSKSKSQSLSNFDWSHQQQNQSRQQQQQQQPPRRLIDLRSVKSSSIRMNFDDNEDVDVDQHFGGDEMRRSATPQVASSKYNRRKSSFPMQQNTSISSRRAIISLNKEINNWTRPSEDNVHKSGLTKSPSIGAIKQSASIEETDVINEEEDEEHDEQAMDQQAKEANNDKQTNLAKLKVSRSSIGSSNSSSSGCPENDYFISNSSSSMSSSTGSHECELFSQPASSSGIVCSGNTSDEYDNIDARNNKKQQQQQQQQQVSTTDKNNDNDLPKSNGKDSVVKKQQTITNNDNNGNSKPQSKHPRSSSMANAATKTRQNIRSISRSRCCNVKTVDMAGERGDDLICGHNYNDNHHQSCDCDVVNGTRGPMPLPSDAISCDCCCDCLVDIYQTPPAPIETNIQVDRCDCDHTNNHFQDDCHEEESIYERLPRPGKLGYGASRAAISRRSINVALSPARPSSAMTTNVNEDDVDVDYDDIQPLPLPAAQDPKRSTLKDMKQSNPSASWLERRKYIKLFPKFMFSSSSSSNNNNNNDNMKQTGPKSGTLDKSLKFRRTRSSQNLMTR